MEDKGGVIFASSISQWKNLALFWLQDDDINLIGFGKIMA